MKNFFVLLLLSLCFLSLVSCLFPGHSGYETGAAGAGAGVEAGRRLARRESGTVSGIIRQKVVGDKRGLDGNVEEGVEEEDSGPRVRNKMVRREITEETEEALGTVVSDSSSVPRQEITEDDLLFSKFLPDNVAIYNREWALPTSILKQFILNVVIPLQGNAIKMNQLFEKRYTLIKKIGQSLYNGSVYLADTKPITVPVVVKLSNWLQLAKKMQIKEKELEEADKDKVKKWKQMKLVVPSTHLALENPFTALQLQMLIPAHKNIAQVYEVSYTHIDHVIVMEYCSGGDLFDFITKLHFKRRVMSQKFVKLFFRQIAEAVLHMHRHGVVHLDISLENILVQPVDSDSKFELKLIDFGHARKIKYDGLGNEVQISDYTMRPGKPGYRSPECSLLHPHLGTLSDVFSLGYVLFRMATAVLPFTDFPDSLSDSYEEIIRFHPRELVGRSRVWELIPSSELQDLLFQMFQPEERRISLLQVLDHPWLSLLSETK